MKVKIMKKRLQLHPLEKEDLSFVYEMHVNPEVSNFWCQEPFTTMTKMEKAYLASQESDTLREFILMEKNQRLGFLGLYNINYRHRHAEFAIMIHPSHQGKGYAEKASRLLIEYSFNQLNLHKLYLDVVKHNEKAIHIYQKIGFETEGELKQQYFIDGQYYDSYQMGLLRKDYKN